MIAHTKDDRTKGRSCIFRIKIVSRTLPMILVGGTVILISLFISKGNYSCPNNQLHLTK